MLTELTVVNAMLAATGVRPITAETSTHPSYVQARNKLTQVNIEAQSIGHWYNTDVLTLAKNTDNNIILPQQTLRVDPTDTEKDFVKRGTRLYDKGNASFTISAGVEVKITILQPFDDLPVSAQYYIRDKAVYDYYVDEDGIEPKLSVYRAAKMESWLRLMREDLASKDVNIFKGSSANTHMRRGTYVGRGRLPGTPI